jgi:hypothetical protein
MGSDLRIALVKSGRNHSQLRRVGYLLQKLNAEAWDLLSSTAEALLLLGKQFKEILQSPGREKSVIVNYRELQFKEKERPLTQRLILSYKRIYSYLRIQQLLTEKE